MRNLCKERIVYITPGPNSVKIYSQSELAGYHQKGRFLDVLADQLVFARKRRKKEKKCVASKRASCGSEYSSTDQDFELEACSVYSQCSSSGNFSEEILSTANDQGILLGNLTANDDRSVDEPSKGDLQILQHRNDSLDPVQDMGIDRKKLENEHAKLTQAVAKLTIDPERKVDHKSVLEAAAKRLNDARLSNYDHQDTLNVDAVKKMINECKTGDEIFKVLWSNPQFQSRFSSLFSSKLLEQLMSIGSLSNNPMKSFPVDINTNVYADIVHFALDHAKDVFLLLATLTKKHETPISAKDVIELAFSFSSLAESASSHNKALKKIKSISMRSSGLTNAGLDSLSSVGASETSRTFRNDRDLLASISEEIVKQYARKNIAQFTFDNLDICINKVQHHLTLNFLEFEQNDTSKLSTDTKSRKEMLAFFSLETILLQSRENQEMFSHYQFVTAHTLARLFGKEIAGMEWLRSAFQNHYQHPNSETSSNRSLMHVDKPMYLQETKNSGWGAS